MNWFSLNTAKARNYEMNTIEQLQNAHINLEQAIKILHSPELKIMVSNYDLDQLKAVLGRIERKIKRAEKKQ
jgi:hypothetical protein